MKPPSPVILIVDDIRSDQLLITHAIRKSGVDHPIHCLSSGNEAIAYLDGRGKFSDRARFPYPSFIVTDLKMPDGDGFSILAYLQHNPQRAVMHTVVFSSSADVDDIHRSYLLGASSYFVKPTDIGTLQRLIKILTDYWCACEIPEVDSAGRWKQTESAGKLGERFARMVPEL
ncbi:MAG: response regulator receiver protein [Pedosphaera sp.]|nr:response regulator receiver protein [Pedosphaera sp.]